MANIVISLTGTSITRVDFNDAQDLENIVFNNNPVYSRRASLSCQIELTADIVYNYYSEAATCGWDYYDYLGLDISKLTFTAYNYRRIKSLVLTGVTITYPGTITATNYDDFTKRFYIASHSITAVSGTKYTLIDGTGTGDIPNTIIAYLSYYHLSNITISGTKTNVAVQLYFELSDDAGTGSYVVSNTFTVDVLKWPVTLGKWPTYGILSTNTATATLYNKDIYKMF